VGAQADPLTDAKALLENVDGASAHRYAAHDDHGVTLDGLDVLQLGPRHYLGVYHALIGGHYEVRVATSGDLMQWAYRSTLDTDAAQPSIVRLPGGAFVVAYEKGSTLRVLPLLHLPDALTAPPANLWTLNKNNLRFRAYADLAGLLAAKPVRRYTAPHRLSRTDEGTPDLTVKGGSGPKDAVVGVTFHHFADLDGDRLPDADRQAAGTLTGLRRWTAAATPGIDAPFLGATVLHPGFVTPPAGNIGDRDAFGFEGASLVAHEAQYKRQDFGSWRLFLRDATSNALVPLVPRTAGGSSAYGNPSVVALTAPDGRPALLFTAFVFSEGAAAGEAGELLALHEL
jgi:hypothetical protein